MMISAILSLCEVIITESQLNIFWRIHGAPEASSKFGHQPFSMCFPGFQIDTVRTRVVGFVLLRHTERRAFVSVQFWTVHQHGCHA